MPALDLRQRSVSWIQESGKMEAHTWRVLCARIWQTRTGILKHTHTQAHTKDRDRDIHVEGTKMRLWVFSGSLEQNQQQHQRNNLNMQIFAQWQCKDEIGNTTRGWQVACGTEHEAWGMGARARARMMMPHGHKTRRHVAQTLCTWQRQKPEPSNRLWFTIYTFYPSFHPATLSLSLVAFVA